MPRRKEDLEKVTVRLHTEDKGDIDEFYPTLGHNKVIRKLVSNHLKQLREKLNEKRSETHDDIPATDIDLDAEVSLDGSGT